MPVKVNREPDAEHFAAFTMESCLRCKVPTRYWWGHGCFPLCVKCADIVDYSWCKRKAEAGGYGPIPKNRRRKLNKPK